MDTNDRKNIILVSKKWYDILQDKCFFNDNHLKLYNCVLKNGIPPISIFEKSTRKFYNLFLGANIKCCDPDLAKKMLIQLGSNVHCLDIIPDALEPLGCYSLKNFFPNLKELVLNEICHVALFNTFPDELEHLHLKKLSVVLQGNRQIECLQKIPNLKKITADSVRLDEYIFNSASKEKHQFLIKVDQHLQEALIKLNSSERQNLYVKFNASFLLLDEELKVDDVSGLEFSGRESFQFRELRSFQNLKSLTISWDVNSRPISSDDTCFYEHESIFLPNIQELKLNWMKWRNCIRCFHSMIYSFPNLKKLIIYHNEITDEHVKFVCCKLPNLEHLEVESNQISNDIIIGNNKEFLLGNLSKLVVLNLSEAHRINGEGLENIPLMPCLKKIELGTVQQVSKVKILIIKCLAQLKILSP